MKTRQTKGENDSKPLKCNLGGIGAAEPKNAVEAIVGGVNLSSSRPTKKQETFAKLVGDGVPQVEAYREAYDSGGNPNTERVEAHRLANNPNVAPMIEERRMEIARVAQRSARSRSAWVIERLVEEAEGGEDSNASARIRALEILGKASGLFDAAGDRESKRKEATQEELERELAVRLSELHPALGSIDTERVVSEIDGDGDDEPPTPL